MKPNEHNAHFSVLIILFFLNKFPYISINAALHECFHIFTCTVLVKKINILHGYTGSYHSRFLHTFTLINFWQDCCVLYRFELSPNFLNT